MTVEITAEKWLTGGGQFIYKDSEDNAPRPQQNAPLTELLQLTQGVERSVKRERDCGDRK